MAEEKHSKDIRYGMSKNGPEKDHAKQIDRQAKEAADRLTREYEAEMQAQQRGW